jgi:hypothetical protein
MKKKTTEPEPVPLFANFTTAMGLALGELLLLSGTPDELEESIRSILLSARATLMSSELRWRDSQPSKGGKSLVSAALGVVRTWHERAEDLAALGDAIAALQDVLEKLGVRYVAPTPKSDAPEMK